MRTFPPDNFSRRFLLREIPCRWQAHFFSSQTPFFRHVRARLLGRGAGSCSGRSSTWWLCYGLWKCRGVTGAAWEASRGGGGGAAQRKDVLSSRSESREHERADMVAIAQARLALYHEVTAFDCNWGKHARETIAKRLRALLVIFGFSVYKSHRPAFFLGSGVKKKKKVARYAGTLPWLSSNLSRICGLWKISL